jgi:hypothetical protein
MFARSGGLQSKLKNRYIPNRILRLRCAFLQELRTPLSDSFHEWGIELCPIKSVRGAELFNCQAGCFF